VVAIRLDAAKILDVDIKHDKDSYVCSYMYCTHCTGLYRYRYSVCFGLEIAFLNNTFVDDRKNNFHLYYIGIRFVTFFHG
jgi:hypothetical protein